MSLIESVMLILRLVIPTILSEISTRAFLAYMQMLQFRHSFGCLTLQHGPFLHLLLQFQGRCPQLLGGDGGGSSNRIIGGDDAIFGKYLRTSTDLHQELFGWYKVLFGLLVAAYCYPSGVLIHSVSPGAWLCFIL